MSVDQLFIREFASFSRQIATIIHMAGTKPTHVNESYIRKEVINMTAMPAMLVSEQILFERSALNIPTDPMQVLKLVYLSHGWVLGIHSEPLIGEPVEAWTYGPVVPSVYFTYKRFGRNPITDDTQDVSFGFTDEQLYIIRAVLDLYKDTPGATLSAITHKKGSPWDITFHKYGTGSIIPNDLIKNYYKALIGNQQ